jgi:hypothetical protein
MPTAFRIAWDSAVIGKILKYDEDPKCSYCHDPIPDGKQYGCEQCGQDVCESCMIEEGGYDNPGYRGEIDSGHPIENHPEFNGGAYCVQCVSDMLLDGSLDDEGNPIIPDDEDEYGYPIHHGQDDEEMPVPPDQEVAVPENPFANMTDAELAQRISALTQSKADIPFLAELVEEAARRTAHGDPNQRANMTAQMEGSLNDIRWGMGEDPMLVKPPLSDREFGFPEGFGDKFASADAFTSAWDVVKHGRI